MSDYYLLRDGKTLGPYPAANIRAWAAAGQLPATDLFCPVGEQQWGPLAQWPELAIPTAYAPPTPAAQPLRTGLSAWVTRGWEIVSTDVGPFIGATVLVMLLSIVTLGICGPPLTAGLYLMALRKHDGHAVAANDVMGGFKYFGATWGLALLVGLPVMILMGAIFGLVFVMVRGDFDNLEHIMPMLQFAIQVPANAIGIFAGTILLFAIPLIVDREYGSVQALQESWAAVKPQFWSYFGTYFIIQMINGAGGMLCGIGALFTYPLSIACIIACYRSAFPRK